MATPKNRSTDAPNSLTGPESHPFKPSGDRRPAPGLPAFDRRLGLDRREIAARLAGGGKVLTGERDTGLERRRGPGRRRTDFTKSAEEGEMNREQFLFLMAVDAFKKSNDVLYPTWSDVLEVVRLLGYRKTMPSELNIRGAEDFREAPDALSGVRAKPGHPELKREAA